MVARPRHGRRGPFQPVCHADDGRPRCRSIVDVGGRVSTRAGVGHRAVDSPVPKHRGRRSRVVHNSASNGAAPDRVSTSSRVGRLIDTGRALQGGYRGRRPTILVPPAMMGHGCWRRPSPCGGLRRASRCGRSRVGIVHRFVPSGRWQIAEGPWVSTQQVVDGVGWGYGLRRGEERQSLVVIVSRRALRLEDPDSLPHETREAIATQGRSEAEKAADRHDPPGCVVLGRNGYLPAPRTLQRLGHT